MSTTPQHIAYRTAASPVGLILVARVADASRISAVLIGEREAELRAELASRFPGARVERDETDIGDAIVERVLTAIATPASADEIPIDPRGTSFQHVVWNALRLVPAGTTTTYSDLARRVGRPNAVRAVAGACAANPIAILIPCHRVVRRDGDLSGYRWGVERKRALLDLEHAVLPASTSSTIRTNSVAASPRHRVSPLASALRERPDTTRGYAVSNIL